MENLLELDRIPVGTAEDFTGKTFGRLKVLYRIKNKGKTRGAKWRCQCSCQEQNIIDVFASNLKNGHTTSCGCLQKEKISERIFLDETGNRYGRLLVLERDNSFSKGVKWICQCDCGKKKSINANSLRRGLTQSCGCYKKEQVSKRAEKNYVGKTFHYITILNREDQKNLNGESVWKCLCNLCGKEFFLTTSHLKDQISCGCLKQSYGVSIICSILKSQNIEFETEKTFETCNFKDSGRKARFDFYIQNKYLIEFDGQQHYTSSSGWNTEENLKKTQERDQYKNQWCKENNIPLIRIPYWKINDLSVADLKIETSQYLVK